MKTDRIRPHAGSQRNLTCGPSFNRPCAPGLGWQLAGLLFLIADACAGNFSGSARLEVADPTGALSWNPSANALTVQCWFKLSVPSGTNLTENLTILANRRGGSTNDAHAFLIEYDIYTGNVEFSSRGSGFRRFPLVKRPFLDRWYHVAVVRQGEQFSAFLDGRALEIPVGAAVGDARSTDGLSVGGWIATDSQGRYLFGEVQEVSIYQAAWPTAFINQNMFAEQPAISELKGYFKLGFSTNTAENLRNFAPVPVASGTETASKQGSGTVEFEEVNQAGEQSAFDARRNGGRDALTPLSGAFVWEQTALSRPTPGVAFDFRFAYSSANGQGGAHLGGTDPYEDGPLGKGWRHTFETRVVPAGTFSPLDDTDTLGLMLWDGALQAWDLDHDFGGYREYLPRDKEYKGNLVLTTTNCQWTTPERLVYVFKRPDTGSAVMRGRLSEIRDFNGNRVRVGWDETRGRLTNVVDSASGAFAFDTNSLLRSVTFGAWQVNFAYDATNRLISKSITNTAGLYADANTTWQFGYNSTHGLLERIVDPRGNTNVFVQYDQYGRKTNAMDALGRETRTEFGVPGKRQLRHTDAADSQWIETYDRKGRILAQQDPLTNITRHTYDERGNRTSITEPLGWTTLFAYDDRANVVARTNALGEVTRWTYHSFFNKAIQQISLQPSNVNGSTTWTNFYAYDGAGNLTNHSDDLGSLVSYTYTTNGLVQTSIDANDRTSSFGYDPNGFLTSRTDPAGNTTTYDVNEVGWKLREVNPLGDTTTFTLDVNGNATRVQDVLGRVFLRTYDPNGNLLTTTDGKEQVTTHSYDAANQRTNTTDRTGSNKWLTFYTLRGKIDRVTDPLGNTVTNIYDDANRLIRVADPMGGSLTNQYDANGNLVALFDKLGRRWSKTHDRLNRVVTETDPLGNTRATSFDTAGRILQTATPNGNATLHAYDGRGRLAKWLDAEGFDWLYAYDGVGNITNITDALGGHYVMTYGLRNERTLERNQDGFEWRYEYDELRRLKRQTDPNGTVRTPTYDAAGRILFVDFSTGRRDSFAYDANDKPLTISRRVSGVTTATQFIYDRLDRPVEQSDGLAQTVRYGYDPLGRVIALTYPGGRTLTNRYDAVGRLTNQVDWAGRQMTYAYDPADRLILRSWPNGVTQTNTFDEAGRITGLSHAAVGDPSTVINLALAYAYDKNGNKTGSSEKGTLAWPQPSLTDETARYTPGGRLVEREIEITNQTARISYSYDPSGNLTNATGNSQSWSLAYDEDNRTTSIHWDAAPITAKQIVNRYDALGRRISRTVDGATTGYVLSLTGGMERILCDLNSGGAVTAYYVHGPDLCYRVDAAHNVVYYHSDAMANVISLTGSNGTNLTQYAYTPYGRSLGSANGQSQSSNPYLFVGSQGVMNEFPDLAGTVGDPGLYFMRARYYSAEAGVFLSTDPVKKIGPGWKPLSYGYAKSNPQSHFDPEGLAAVPIYVIYYRIEQHLLRPINDVLDVVEARTAVFANTMSSPDYAKYRNEKLRQSAVNVGADLALPGSGMWIDPVVTDDPVASLLDNIKGYVPLTQTWDLSTHLRDITWNIGGGIGNRINDLISNRNRGSKYTTLNSSPTALTTPIATIPTQSQHQSQSFSDLTPGVESYGQSLNNQQQNNPAPNSNGSGPTTQTGSGASTQSSGSNAFGRAITSITQSQAYQNISTGFRAVANAIRTAISSAVTSARNTVSRLLGWP